MLNTFARVVVRGETSQILLPRLPIDQQVFFKMLPFQILFEIGASCESLKVNHQRKDGLSVEAKVFSIIASAQRQRDATLSIAFEAAQPVLGARFLQDPGLRINSGSGTLEPTSDWGFAYNH